MKDYLGNEIHVGDIVYYSCVRKRGFHQEVSEVIKLTEKSVGLTSKTSWLYDPPLNWVKPQHCVVLTTAQREMQHRIMHFCAHHDDCDNCPIHGFCQKWDFGELTGEQAREICNTLDVYEEGRDNDNRNQ